MYDDKLFDALVKVKLAEKKLQRMINQAEASEKKMYRKLVKALLIKDYSTARRIAKSIIQQRRRKRSLESLLDQIRTMKNNLEMATAINVYSEGVKIAQKALKDAEKNLNSIIEANTISDIDSLLTEIELQNEPILQQLEEKEVDDLIKRAELAVLDELEEEIPGDIEEAIEEEVSEVERERED